MIRTLALLPALLLPAQAPPLAAPPLAAPPPAAPPPAAATLPPALALPGELEVKPGSIVFQEFDRETFDLKPAGGNRPVPVPVAGRIWRFVLRSAGRPVGAFALLERLLPALEQGGWTLEWRERAIAKRSHGDRTFWLKASAGTSGELKLVLAEKADPRVLDLPLPGLRPELPRGTEDFPYLPPWPGAKLQASNTSRSPVDVKFPDGTEHIMMVNFLDKEYSLAKPPTDYEFLVVYREALERAGWTLEGTLRGGVTQIQATYIRRGRDLRATLRLLGDAMGISVADVGAQLVAEAPARKP